MVEYCSRLAKSGQYKFDPTKDQNFSAISCRCLDTDNNVYKDGDEIKQCSHATMLQDANLFNYIFSIVNDPNSDIEVTDLKKQAVNNYNKDTNYDKICSQDIYDILEKDGPIIIDYNSYSADNILKSTCKIEYTVGKQKKVGMGTLILISKEKSWRRRKSKKHF